MKIGLVLEGGAMRGMYTAGALDVFMKKGLKADCVVGVSAGALFGVNYISGQVGRAIRYSKRYNSDRDYLGLRPLIKEGNIVSTKFAYDYVPHELDLFDNETYKRSDIPFYAVVTNIKSGQPEYIKINDVFEQMNTLRASGSMPFVSKPVEIDGGLYLDGGITDSIPFLWMKSQGCDKVIVILTRDITYKKNPSSKLPAKLFYRDYPLFAQRINDRYKMYNSTVDTLLKWERAGNAFVIRPSKPIKIAKMEKDPEKLQAVYDLGVSDTESAFAELEEFINN